MLKTAIRCGPTPCRHSPVASQTIQPHRAAAAFRPAQQPPAFASVPRVVLRRASPARASCGHAGFGQNALQNQAAAGSQAQHGDANEGVLAGLPFISKAMISCARIASGFLTPRGGLKTILLGNRRLGLSSAGGLAFTIGWPSTSIGELLAGLSQNYVFMVGFVAWFIAQFMKIFTYRARKGKWRLKACVDSGGMPSSHSSLCSGVTTAVGLSQGFTSPMFALGICFSVIVMYDAAGVRRHAGKQAEVLNMIIRDLWEGHPVSEQQLLAVLRSPGITDFQNVNSSLEDDQDRELTLSQHSSRSFDEGDLEGQQTVTDQQLMALLRNPELNNLASVRRVDQGQVAEGNDPNSFRKMSMEQERKWRLERLEKVNAIRSTVDDTILGEKKLKEVLGHTPVQVGAGAALGVIVGLCLKPIGA